MKIVTLKFLPDWSSNIYVIGEEEKPAIVIDPSSNYKDALDRYIEKHHHGLIEAILLTHYHIDHWYGLLSLKSQIKQILAPLGELEGFASPYLNLSSFLINESLTLKRKITSFHENEIIKIANFEDIKPLLTHFHTANGAAYYLKESNALFSGDALFHLSIGRSDLPGGNEKSVLEDLKQFTFLPTKTKIYPGHDKASTIANEILYNPYLKVVCR